MGEDAKSAKSAKGAKTFMPHRPRWPIWIVGIAMTIAVGLLGYGDNAMAKKVKKTARKAKKRRVIRLDGLQVKGRHQKPQAFYILQRSSLNFGEANLDQSFLPKILKSLESPPF